MTMAFEFGKFLENPDALYMLAGAGSAFAGKDNPMGMLGKMTMAGIAADNQRKFMSAILGLGGDIKLNKDKVTINAPPSAFQTGDPSKLATGQGAQGVVAPAAPEATPTSGGQSSAGNPTLGSLGSSEGISLAGLSPEDIRGALQIGLASQEIQRKRLSDIDQGAYWTEMAKNQKMLRDVQMAKAENVDTRTTEIKNYEYAVGQGFKGSIVDFKKSMESMPNSYQEWQLTDRSVPYGKWLMDKAKAGALTIDESVIKQRRLEEDKNKIALKGQGFQDDLDR